MTLKEAWAIYLEIVEGADGKHYSVTYNLAQPCKSVNVWQIDVIHKKTRDHVTFLNRSEFDKWKKRQV